MVQKKNDYIAMKHGGQSDDQPGKDLLNKWLDEVGTKRDRESFKRLFNHFAPRIKSFLMKGGTSESQADELAQETMLTVWDKAGSFNAAQASASTWIFTIARNKRIDALRKIKRTEVDYEDLNYSIEGQEKSPLQNLSETEETDVISEALKSLPEEQADLIKKSFFEDKSHAEIAKETGIPLGTVKSRIRLALERLRTEKKVNAL